MGSLPTRGGVRAKGTGRVQFDFNFHGTRYRPTIVAEPTESNLQRARAKLRRIKVPIAAGTFSFNEEFPSYRYKQRLARSFSPQTCNDVFDAYLAHCAARLAKFDLAYATLASYRRAIDSTWRPAIGSRRFDQVNRRSRGAHHRDSSGLGQAQGNYDEFRFFTGLRPSEEIALLVSDCDLVKGTIAITKARVMARDKDRTKTSCASVGSASASASITGTCSSKTMASRSDTCTMAGSAGGTRSSASACDHGRRTRRGTPSSRGV
jgi:hypothetical protein